MSVVALEPAGTRDADLSVKEVARQHTLTPPPMGAAAFVTSLSAQERSCVGQRQMDARPVSRNSRQWQPLPSMHLGSLPHAIVGRSSVAAHHGLWTMELPASASTAMHADRHVAVDAFALQAGAF